MLLYGSKETIFYLVANNNFIHGFLLSDLQVVIGIFIKEIYSE